MLLKKRGYSLAIGVIGYFVPVTLRHEPSSLVSLRCTWRVRGTLVSTLITPITHIVTLVIPLINLPTKSPYTQNPPSRSRSDLGSATGVLSSPIWF